MQLRINKILKSNLPTSHSGDIDDLYICDNGELYISNDLGGIVKLNNPIISKESNNGIKYVAEDTPTQKRGLYFEDLTNREILDGFSVDNDGKLLYNEKLINIDISTDDNNILQLKTDGLYVPIDDELSTTSSNPIMNKVVAKKLNDFEDSITDGKKKIARSVTLKGVQTYYTDSFDTIATNIDNIPSGGSGKPAQITFGDFYSKLEVEEIPVDKDGYLPPIPYSARLRQMCQVGNIIHIIGGIGATNANKHYIYNADTKEWVQYNDLPIGVNRGGLVYCQGKLYIMGGAKVSDGSASTAYNYMYYWNEIDDSWTNIVTLSDGTEITLALPQGLHSFSYCIAPDVEDGEECIYIIGGHTTSSTYLNKTRMFKPSTLSWIEKAVAPQSKFDTVCFYDEVNNQIYHIGGYTSKQVNTNYCYDIATDTWITKTPFPIAMDFIGANALYYNNRFIISHKNSISLYDVDNDSWETIAMSDTFCCALYEYNNEIYGFYESANLPTLFVNHCKIDIDNGVIMNMNTNCPYSSTEGLSICYYKGKIYTACSYESALSGTAGVWSQFLYSYDLETNKWTRLKDIPIACGQGSIIGYNDKIYIIGSRTSPYTQFCCYDLDTEEYTILNNLPFQSNVNWRSTLVYKDEIHVLGNYSASAKTTHYKYDVVTDSWTSVSTLPYAFYYGSAVVLDDKLHILSGYGDGNGHYIFNDADSTWTKLDDLASTSTNGINTFVQNGKIYFVNNNVIYNVKDTEKSEFTSNMAFGSLNLNLYPSVQADDGWVYFVTNFNNNADGFNGLFRARVADCLELISTERVFIENEGKWIDKDVKTLIKY